MLEKYYLINQAAGISIHIHPDGSLSVAICAVSVEQNQLEITQKIPAVSSIDEIKNILSPKTIVSINLSGKGILHKKIDKTEDLNATNFNIVLPNANPDDFYIQNFISGDKSFVSVIRKADADKWLNTLADLGVVAIMLSLGPFSVHHITSQLNVYEDEIIFDGNIIQREENGNWANFRYDLSARSPFALKVDIELIDERLIIAYASAFQLVLASKLDPVKADVASLQISFDQKIADTKLKVQAFIVLAVLFVLLLINFAVFSWLGSSNAVLARQASLTAQSSTDIEALNKQIKEKDSLVQALGCEGGINKSTLVDQIASMLPPEVTWKEVALDPVDLPSTRLQKSLAFYNRQIMITGNSEKIIPVNEWIARIKTRDWVKNVQLVSYTYNSELNTGQFTITIDY